MISLIPKIFAYKLFYRFNWPKVLPMNLTIGVSFNCNSRCQTCNAWKKKSKDLTLGEWDKIFQSLGGAPFWFTVSGGEPFLRKDLAEVVKSLYRNCQPKIINIPTNGLLYQIIPQKVEEILKSCPKSQIIVNLSLDGIGKKHDLIRGVPGSFEKAMKTYKALRDLKYPNFTLGIHTVISKFNIDEIPQIYKHLIKLNPDSYVTEIAEEREELDTKGMDIAPSADKYSQAVDFLLREIKKVGQRPIHPWWKRFKKISRITQAFRIQYYQIVKKVLKQKKQIIPCYAGFASAQISPSGNVWPCCIKAESIGNLAENNFNFKKIWLSKKADEIRQEIKSKKCYCPLANVSYTNMLLNFRTLIKVIFRL